MSRKKQSPQISETWYLSELRLPGFVLLLIIVPHPACQFLARLRAHVVDLVIPCCIASSPSLNSPRSRSAAEVTYDRHINSYNPWTLSAAQIAVSIDIQDINSNFHY